MTITAQPQTDVSPDFDWFDLLELSGQPPLFRSPVSRRGPATSAPKQEAHESVVVETDAASFAAVVAEWPEMDQERRRSILFEIGELHLARVALANLPDAARAKAGRQVAELSVADHRLLAREIRGVLGEVRRDDPEAQAQALDGPLVRGRDRDNYLKLRVLRALVFA